MMSVYRCKLGMRWAALYLLTVQPYAYDTCCKLPTKASLCRCKREMRWTAQYLLKMHNYAGIDTGAPRPAKWRDEDKLIMMVCSHFDHVPAAGCL